jgi:DegV family protein with EDD domain
MSSTSTTAVISDSTSYLPAKALAERGIDLVSLYVTLEGTQRKETEIDDYSAFYSELLASDEGATTSQPSVGDFLAVYRPHLEAGREIISVHLSAGISGTFESASQARAQLLEEGVEPDAIQVYDSRSACAGLGIIVLAASNAARQGASATESLTAAETTREELGLWFGLNTLEYLRKGGRIGAARALLGTAIQIKPILSVEEEIKPVERVRTRRRVFERLLQLGRELQESGRDGWIVQHIQDRERANQLAEAGREVFGCDPVFISEIGPVIGAHTGPGLLGIGGVRREHIA